MKKTVVTLILFSILTSYSVNAQLRTALTGGAHIASVQGNHSAEWDTIQYDYASRTGFHAGLQTDVPLSYYSKFHFQSGMFFSNKGRSFSTSYDSTTSPVASIKAKQFVNYMEIPLNLVYKLDIGKKSKLIFGGGPYVAFLFNGREKKDTYFTNGTTDLTENTSLKVPKAQGKYNNIDYGVNGLFGIELGRVFLTGNYSRGLNNFYQPASKTGDFKHQVMGATLGIYLDKNTRAEKEKKPKKEKKPRDRDRDGVPDDQDECPRKKGSIATHGCPDKDSDGIPDKDDKCPEFTGSAKYHGCPAPDTDKDGVNDDMDKCPDVKGTVQNKGCPEINKDIIEKMDKFARRIQFKYKSTELSKKSTIILDGVAKILKENNELNVSIQGYTSGDGNPKNHLRLSQERAESVKSYLIMKGISGKRLTATGFGEANPLNKEKTEAERALNRRVELKMSNH